MTRTVPGRSASHSEKELTNPNLSEDRPRAGILDDIDSTKSH